MLNADEVCERLVRAEKRLNVVAAACRPSCPATVRNAAQQELPLVEREIAVLRWVLDETKVEHA